MRRILGLIFILVAALVLSLACGESESRPAPQSESKGEKVTKEYTSPPDMTLDINQAYSATMHTSKGEVVFELYASEAPKTVNNFVFLAREGFYNDVVFHRIIKDFMIQSGDPKGTGAGGPGYRFEDEPVTRDYLPGTLAMANAGPNTNGSQFFIMHGEVALPKNYTIFGRVVDGMEVVNALADTPVAKGSGGELSKPIEPPVITRIDISQKEG
jgi:cyclophilin family peptidyl-prolyl cis-trans isomerase